MRNLDKRTRRGAALIIAIAIMTVLLAIGLTFFTVARVESTTAKNVVNTVRAEHLVDAGFAIAEYQLNRDLQDHPQATSLDHSWRTLFNGAAFQGKTWAQGATGPMFNLEPVEDALRNNLATDFSSSLLYVKFTRDGENYTEPLFRGPRTAKWLAIPRWQGNEILLYAPEDEVKFCNSLGAEFTDAQINAAVASANVRFVRFDDTILDNGNKAGTYNAGLYPFVTPSFYGAPQRFDRDGNALDFPMGNDPRWAAEQVHTWADVDTDGDGMRDSIWLPMPKDVDLSADGIDNDLDGVPDPVRTATAANASVVDEEGVTRHDFEIGAFAYAVDVDSGRIVRGPEDIGASGTVARLTLPLPGLRIAIDMNNDGQLNEKDRYTAGAQDAAGEFICAVLPQQIRVARADGTTAILTIRDTDRLDNDYDLFVNGFSAYAFLGDPNNTSRGAEAEAPDADYVNGNFQALGIAQKPVINSSLNARTKFSNTVVKWPAVAPGISFTSNAPTWLTTPAEFAPVVITVSGEPVCDVIGRAAIHVADETAKVNMNAVGGHVYRGDLSPDKGNNPIANAGNMIGRAINDGASTFEYETRALPEVGKTRADYFWGMLTGAGFMLDAPAGTLWDFSTLPVENQTLADAIPHAPLQPFAYDISLPGYGRVDDNMNALLLAFNGRADAGTDVPDQGLWIPFLSPLTQRVYRDGLTVSDARQNLVNDERHAPGATLAPHAEVAAARVRRPADDYLNRLGMMEGIDEPGELRSAAPLRNLLAETDSLANNTNGVSGDNNNDGIANEIGEAGDRLLGNHYELQKPADESGNRIFDAADWPNLKNFVTANSDARNVNYVETAQGLRAVNKIDPNLAPPAQLAAAMITKGDIRPATDYRWKGDGNYKISLPSLLTLPGETGYAEDVVKKLYFAEGLRQADTTVEGWIFAEGPVVPRGGTDLAMPRFEADPQLQAMQVAVNVADSRDADPARSLLVMDKRVNAGYQTWLEQWFKGLGLSLPSTPFPQPEPLNAREKIDEKDLFPVGDFQEYLINALGGKNADKRVVAVDAWWQYLTDEVDKNITVDRQDRPISYAVAGADAIRISEMMVRPVRRIEAEADTSGTTQNLNPTPRAGMPVFDLAMTLPLGAGNSAWKMRSPYDTAPASGGAAAADPYILGDETAWVYNAGVNPGWTQAGDNTPLNVNTDIVEFRIKATDGMPPGRYYLTVNVVDPTTGQMTVTDVDQLEYSVKYFNSDTVTYGAPNGTISDDVAFIENLVANTATETAQKALLRADYFKAFWQSVDRPEFIATQGRRDSGSGAPEGWVFAPSRPLDQALFPDAAAYSDLQNSNSGTVFADLFDVPRDTTAPQPYPPLGPPYPADAPFRWSQAYFRDSVLLVDPATALVGADQPAPGVATLTVNVPPAVSQYDTVCIAFRLKPLAQNIDTGTGLPRRLAVNFLDFSQQPDHEYVELQNTTDQRIDLTGWTLEIGIPDPYGINDSDLVQRDPFKSRWVVPDGTSIAPKGYLLLGFDRFDEFQVSPTPDLIKANGMGLAAGTADPAAPANVRAAGQYVTEPPIAATATTAAPLYNVLADATGSVFRRNVSAAAAGVVDTDWADLIDNDGDGVSSAPFVYGTGSAGVAVPAVLRTLDRDTDGVAAEVRHHGNDEGVVPPYARIVQLTAKELWWDKPYQLDTAPVGAIDSLARVAEVVLRGGFLPDYPEHDGYDNDGDGGYARTATLVGTGLSYVAYERGTLDKDMVDNNLDGRVDECGKEIYGVLNANPFLSEGVDEGRIAPYYFPEDGYRPRTLGYGSFEEGSLPLWMSLTVVSYNEWATALKQGRVGNTLVPNFWTTYLPSQGFPCNPTALSEGGFSMALTTAANPVVYVENSINLSSPRFSPEWKAFCERRWNPGDNVIVTLYVGPSSDRKVADRATYRELDVTNRAVDDIAPSPYLVEGYRNFDYDSATGTTTWAGTSSDAVANVVCLDRDRRQYWLPNQMGLDFYRSLERKHPLYAGDKFGTANRWEATDGNYDDWADSVGPLEAVEDRSQPYNPFAPGTTSRTVNPLPLLADAHTQRLFGHAVSGSPLRMNTTQRIWDNPPDLVALLVEAGKLSDPEDLTTGSPTLLLLDGGRRRQFVESDSVGILLGALTQTFDSRAYTLRRAEVRNRPFNSVADLMKVALPGFRLELGPNNLRLASGFSTDYAERTVNAAVNTRWLPYVAVPPANNPPTVWRQDLSLARTLVATTANRDQATADQQSGNGFAALGELSEIGPVTLTVGQAAFRPILADPALAASQADAAAMLHWNVFQSGGNYQVKAPHAWTPVMLLAGYPTDTPAWSTLPRWGVAYPPPLPIGVPAADKITLSWPAPAAWPRWYTWPVSGQQGPFDPSYRSADAPYLVQTEFLRDPERFSQVFGLLSTGDVDFRWPKQRLTPAAAVNPAGPALQSVEYPRAVMYVSQHNSAYDNYRAEGVFSWDAADGLENGTYIAYVATFIPGMGDSLLRADSAAVALAKGNAPSTVPQYQEPMMPWTTDTPPARDPIAQKLCDLDPTQPHAAGDDRFDPVLAMEFITDPTKADRLEPKRDPATYVPSPNANRPVSALPNPGDWYADSLINGQQTPTATQYRPDGDGKILYTGSGQTTWRAKLVRVTDRFLALRVRNLGGANQVACITAVVLAPARHVAGKININTAENGRVIKGESASAANYTFGVFNTLLGLPGVVDALSASRVSSAKDTYTPAGARLKPESDIGWPGYTVAKSTVDDPLAARWPSPLQFSNREMPPTAPRTGPGDTTSTVLGPPNTSGDWNRDFDGVAAMNLSAMIMAGRTERYDGRYYRDLGELTAFAASGGKLLERNVPFAPLSNENQPDWRFDEISTRFGRMANLITTRSDVFEILVMVQSGATSDVDGDNRVNYRDGNEFTVTAESQGRVIYERRAKADRSDDAVN